MYPSTYQKECIYQQVSAAVNALRVVGIVCTDPGTHNVLYHEDDIDLCNGEEVVHQPEMTAIFGHEAVEQRNSQRYLGG
ncbi:hypothetical protein N7501_002725 [Penicillium viridicatum]|nr:hypothetical protein N7501_002725 [Penicillium viridicatum]